MASSYTVAGNKQEQVRLTQGLRQLEEAQAGKTIAQATCDKSTMVQFGRIDKETIAQYDLATNTITLNDQLKGASPNVLAAHLAHEGTHVQWNSVKSSINEEYHAFKTQANVWRELKGSEVDRQCDWVRGIIGAGEIEAKRRIRVYYSDLDE